MRRHMAAGLLLFTVTILCQAQSGSSMDIEGRLRGSNGQIVGLRIRLVKQSGSRQFTETVSTSDGRFSFRRVGGGDYVIETFETEDFAATATNISVQPVPGSGPMTMPVMIELPSKSRTRSAASVLPADVDVNVPKPAFKHYQTGLKAIEAKDANRAITELQAAVEIFPTYYAARLELGRQLRTEKRFQEAAETLVSLGKVAPTRADPHVEYGLVLLGLEKKEDAAVEFREAIRLEEASWAPHYFLGLALFDSSAEEAEKEFKRALELNEHKAAHAHVAMAKLCLRRGQQDAALKHLDKYLVLAPNAPDAETVKKFVARLRAGK